MSDMERKVYFLQGHGEKEPNRTERDGYSALSGMLRRDNYMVERLVLAQQKEVPDDATVVVIGGPTTDVLPAELEALRRYLARAGKLMVLMDPAIGGQAASMPNLEALVKEWGVTLGNNVVVDVSGVGQLLGTDASVPVAAPPYPSHAIGQGFNLLTAYPLTRSVTPVSGGVNGRTAQTFIQTSANSWGETNLAEMFATRKVENDKAADLQGPISVAAAVSAPVAGAPPAKPPTPGEAAKEEAPKPETRMAVIGDSDFASNSLLGIQGNRDMFLNTLNWLSQQENLISIRPKDPDDRRITLTADQQRWVKLLALLVLPAAIFGAGIFNWTRRRG
jgi:ABC-type uncharacterized transport system involved in gliding motility auxiliary subunit